MVQTKRLKGKSYRDKAMAQESTPKTSKPAKVKPETSSPVSPTAAIRKGLQKEVVVPPVPKKSKAPS